MYRSNRWQWIAMALLVQPAVADVTVVVPQAKQGDAGLALAVRDLCQALGNAKVAYRDSAAALPTGELILLGTEPQEAAETDLALSAEGYRIRPAQIDGRRVATVAGDVRGLMYGTFKLAERVRLGDDPMNVNVRLAPAFKQRMFSEQGQLLDLPDRNYYADEAPYVNEKMLRQEIDEAKSQVDHVAKLGFNTITFLHLGFDEYVDYKYLDGPIYKQGDRHLVRSPVFCRYMTELCDYAHARHLDIYLQLYEIQYPPEVDRLYNVSLDSPNIQKIISAKCRELFERVPLDGLVITTTETHPRCGYASKCLWEKAGRKGAGKMLTLYHNACSAMGKRAEFRTWRIVSDAAGAREAFAYIPKDAVVEVKYTGADFWLNSPFTDIVTGGMGRKQPLIVTFDTFTQYDGWARCFCYMRQWGEYVRLCRAGGVQAINAWGDWSIGCNYPDYEPAYLANSDGSPQRADQVQGWAGYWNNYRMFTRGFTPGQCNAYLLARLAWDPETDVRDIARDWCTHHLGAENAGPAVDALMQTLQPWREYYIGDKPYQIASPIYMKWTTMFMFRAEDTEQAYKQWPLDQMLISNARALKAIDEMQRAFARTNRARARVVKVYDRFAEGIDKTALYLRSLHYFREYWWRKRADHDLKGKAQAENAKARETVRSELMKLMDQWKRYPQEAAMMRITYRHAGEPEILRTNVYPYWWPHGERTTMEGMIAAAESF